MANYLPEERITPVRPRELVVTWVGVALLVLLCNFVLAPRLLEGGRNLAGWIIGAKWRLLLGLEQPVDDLVLGDSSCNQGVNPAVLADALGDRRAVNLCTIGDMLTLNDAWMLGAYVRKFGAPKRVVLVHVYDIWDRSFDWNRVGSIPVGITELRHFRPEIRLKRWQLRSYLEARYFPLYSYNLSLKSRLRLGDPATAGAAGPREVDSLGFLGDTTAYPDSVAEDLRGHLEFLTGRSFELSTDNMRGLREMARLAEQYDFDIYLAPAPIYDRLAGDDRFRRYYAAVHQALARVSSAHLHLVFDQPMVFPVDQLQNADHLVLGAANRYTRSLAARILAIESAAAGPAAAGPTGSGKPSRSARRSSSASQSPSPARSRS